MIHYLSMIHSFNLTRDYLPIDDFTGHQLPFAPQRTCDDDDNEDDDDMMIMLTIMMIWKCPYASWEYELYH